MTAPNRLPLLEYLSALADATRTRILLLLERHELTVSELCAVLQLPQSTVSRHLKILVDGGWIESRREGTRRLYCMVKDELDSPAWSLWDLAREEVSTTAGARQDGRRLAGVLTRRRRRSREFFASAADQWDRMRDELFGARVHSLSLLGLLSDEWTVGDLGCGTGPVAEALAPFVRSVIAVDDSEAMLASARERLTGFANVEVRRGELESLPVEDAGLDAATLVLVLHHLVDPEKVLREVVRVLRPGGRLLVVDMLPHDRHEYHRRMGHVWMGFGEEQIRRLLQRAGLSASGFRPLPVDVEARGPALFAVSATRGPRLDERAGAARTLQVHASELPNTGG